MWPLMVGTAMAQSPWTVTPVFLGTDISGSTGDVATGIAIAGWSATGSMYFAVERESPNGLSRTHRLFVVEAPCPGGWSACGPMVSTEIGVPQDDKLNLPSLAIEPGPLVHVVRGRRFDTCGTPTRELEEQVFDPATGTFSVSSVLVEPACGDLQLSHTVLDGSTAYTCVTSDPPTPGQDNDIWCGSRPPGGAWTMAPFVSGVSTQDHAWLALDGSGGVATVWRDRAPNPDAIGYALGGPPLGELPDGGPFLQNDAPSIAAAPDGSLHAVWAESRFRLSYAKCEVGVDCTVPANLEVQPRAVRIGQVGSVDHPEIAIAANGRMFVVYDEDVDPTSGDQRRIFMKEKCRSRPMFDGPAIDGELVYDIGASTDDQTLLVGRPHVWVDDATSTVHVVFLQKDQPGRDPIHGDAYWAWKPFSPCP